MVIQMVFGNKDSEEKKLLYRNVIKNTQIAKYREGFYANQSQYACGEMYHLKGNTKIIIGRFGQRNG